MSNPLFHNAKGGAKVIQNAYPGPDHHQKLISFANWWVQS